MIKKPQTKICTKCNIEKRLDSFYKSEKGFGSVRAKCKACMGAYSEIYRNEHVKEISASKKAYYAAHFKPRKKQEKPGYKTCTICGVEKPFNKFSKSKGGRFGLRPSCKICNRICSKIYHTTHKKEDRTYRKAHKKERKAYGKANKLKFNVLKKQRRKADLSFNLNNNISGAIRKSLKGNKNGRHWEDIVGFTLKQLKRHLEKLFTEGMTWKRFLNGEIHIDHKTPVRVFNFTKPEHEDFKRCWSLKNLQPLWAKDNITKSNKIEHHFQPSLLI